jgi:D-inositol-3-phosphate glycosyltransferase
MCLLPPGSPEMLVAEVMRQLDVLVFTSNADTAPQLLSEAQASGVPVVARNAGGVGEMFADQLSGFLVDEDPGSVATALENLFETRDKLSHFKENSQKFAIKKFSYKANAEEYLKFYQENLSLI